MSADEKWETIYAVPHPRFKMRPFSKRVRRIVKDHRDHWDAWLADPMSPAGRVHRDRLIAACSPQNRAARWQIAARLDELRAMSVVELMPLMIEF